MHTYSTETTIYREGELHLEHVPFHIGEKVKVIILPPDDENDPSIRKLEYDAFMKGYPSEDSIYDRN